MQNPKPLHSKHIFLSRPLFSQIIIFSCCYFFYGRTTNKSSSYIVDPGLKCFFQASGTYLKLQLCMEMIFYQHLWQQILLGVPTMSPLSTLAISPSLSLSFSYLNLDTLNFIFLDVKACDQHHRRHTGVKQVESSHL